MRSAQAFKIAPIAVWGLMLWQTPSYGQIIPEGLACIKDMQVPAYTSVARRSTAGGTVTATVSIGYSGAVESTKLEGNDADLKEEVRLFLASATFFDSCAGQSVVLMFTFQLQGEPEASPPVHVRFRAPNQFIIQSRPKGTDFSVGKKRK